MCWAQCETKVHLGRTCELLGRKVERKHRSGLEEIFEATFPELNTSEEMGCGWVGCGWMLVVLVRLMLVSRGGG